MDYGDGASPGDWSRGRFVVFPSDGGGGSSRGGSHLVVVLLLIFIVGSVIVLLGLLAFVLMARHRWVDLLRSGALIHLPRDCTDVGGCWRLLLVVVFRSGNNCSWSCSCLVILHGTSGGNRLGRFVVRLFVVVVVVVAGLLIVVVIVGLFVVVVVAGRDWEREAFGEAVVLGVINGWAGNRQSGSKAEKGE